MSDQQLLSNLSPEELQSLQNFRDVVQSDDLGRAVAALRRNRWDVQAAVEDFFGGTDIAADAPPPSDPVVDAGGGSSRYFQWLFQSVPTALNPDEDCKLYVRDYENTYGAERLNFFNGSYTKAVQHAYQSSKFLLVYLHSPLHGDTEAFCRQTLSTPELKQFADQHLVVWAGSTDHAEAYNLSQVLRATRYPFLALLVCQSGRSVQLVDRIQGPHAGHDVLARIQRATDMHRASLRRISTDRYMRDESASLRNEQDREYIEAQEQDRLQLAKKEQEKREREEEEEAERQKADLEDAIKISRELDKQNRYEKISTLVRPEPASGPDAALIKFQLPSGRKLTRNFLKTDTVEDLRNYLNVYFHENDIDISQFSISTNYPKKTLSEDSEVLDNVGLFPRGMLFVQDLEA